MWVDSLQDCACFCELACRVWQLSLGSFVHKTKPSLLLLFGTMWQTKKDCLLLPLQMRLECSPS
jgi:hypothetical protein